MRRLSGLAVAVTLAFVFVGCDEKLSDLTGPTPDLAPTFSSIQQHIFQAADSSGRAACTQCHNAQGARFSGGLNLSADTAYASLVNVASTGKTGTIRVVPGDPDNSYLVQKLEGTPGIVGQRMPRTGGPFLTDGQMLVIRRWIALGAKND